MRWNVLILVGLGYVTILILFCALALGGGWKPSDAYDAVQGPLMALVGGSLAIAKDLVGPNGAG